MFFIFNAEFVRKNLFSFLVTASLAIHALVIFLSPYQIIGLRSLRESFVRVPNEYAVTFELENPEVQHDKTATTDAEKEKDKAKKDDAEKKKYKLFTDTSGNADDEDPQTDTDKIGEKGSVAKDYFPDNKQPVNNEPHAEGRSKAPMLGTGKNGFTDTNQQPHTQQTAVMRPPAPENVSQDKNSPPRFANLPKGLEHLGESTESTQALQSQPRRAETVIKTVASVSGDFTEPEEIKNEEQKHRRERFTVRSQEDMQEPLLDSEGVLIADKQDKSDKPIDKKEPAETPEEADDLKKEGEEPENFSKTNEQKTAKISKPEEQERELPQSGAESQRRLERGLDEQENPGEFEKQKVSFNIDATGTGASKDPAIFEDTISNASIPGAPSFNVKKHEYASYFKHIRDRISLYWFLGYGTRAEIKLETKEDKPVIIEFKVRPDGSVSDIKITDDAGNFQLASRLVASIESAAPLNPFPPDIKEPSIDVKFNFYFF